LSASLSAIAALARRLGKVRPHFNVIGFAIDRSMALIIVTIVVGGIQIAASIRLLLHIGYKEIEPSHYQSELLISRLHYIGDFYPFVSS
jgi:hypothetical protein